MLTKCKQLGGVTTQGLGREGHQGILLTSLSVRRKIGNETGCCFGHNSLCWFIGGSERCCNVAQNLFFVFHLDSHPWMSIIGRVETPVG